MVLRGLQLGVQVVCAPQGVSAPRALPSVLDEWRATALSSGQGLGPRAAQTSLSRTGSRWSLGTASSISTATQGDQVPSVASQA